MHPDLHVPGTNVTLLTSNLLLVLAVAAHSVLSHRWLRADGIGGRSAAAALAAFWLAALVGGRIHHLAAAWSRLPALTWRVVLSPSFHAPGLLLGALVGIGLVVPRLGVPARRFFDGVAAPAGVAFAIARLGCFLNGCCFGTYCPYPWGVVFPRDSPIYLIQVEAGVIPLGASQLAPVHPLQLYFAAAGLAIAAFLYWWRPRRRFDGEIGLAFLALFSSSTALLEPFRSDGARGARIGPWPQLLVLMAVIAAASTIVLLVAEWAARRRTPVTTQ